MSDVSTTRLNTSITLGSEKILQIPPQLQTSISFSPLQISFSISLTLGLQTSLSSPSPLQDPSPLQVEVPLSILANEGLVREAGIQGNGSFS